MTTNTANNAAPSHHRVYVTSIILLLGTIIACIWYSTVYGTAQDKASEARAAYRELASATDITAFTTTLYQSADVFRGKPSAEEAMQQQRQITEACYAAKTTGETYQQHDGRVRAPLFTAAYNTCVTLARAMQSNALNADMLAHEAEHISKLHYAIVAKEMQDDEAKRDRQAEAKLEREKIAAMAQWK